MVGLNVVCGETERAASRLRSTVELFNRRVTTGNLGNGLPTAEDAVAELGGLPEPTRIVPGNWPRALSAAPGRLRELLEGMASEVQTEGFVLLDLIANPFDRQHSYRLIADEFELPDRVSDDLGAQRHRPASSGGAAVMYRSLMYTSRSGREDGTPPSPGRVPE